MQNSQGFSQTKKRKTLFELSSFALLRCAQFGINNRAEEINNFGTGDLCRGDLYARQGCEYNLDIGRRIVVVFAGNRSATGDISEHFTPTAVVVQIFLKIIIVIVGVKEITLVGIDDSISIAIIAGINNTRSSTRDARTIIINASDIVWVTIGAGCANVNLIIRKAATASADVGEYGFIGVFSGVAAKIGMIQAEIFPPFATGGGAILFGCVVGRNIAKGIDVCGNFFERDICAAAIDFHYDIAIDINQNVDVLADKGCDRIADIFAILHRAILSHRRGLIGDGKTSGHKSVFRAPIGILEALCGLVVGIELFVGYALIQCLIVGSILGRRCGRLLGRGTFCVLRGRLGS